MSLSAAALLPLLSQLGSYFKDGVDYYAMLRASGGSITPEALSAIIEMKMAGWDPKLKGRTVLDSETKAATARMLSGLIINMTGVS